MATEGLCEVKTADGYVCTATRTCALNAILLCENCGNARCRIHKDVPTGEECCDPLPHEKQPFDKRNG